MGISNESNRSEMAVSVGALAATRKVVLMKAHKKVTLKSISLLDSAAVAAHADNYVSAQLQVDGANSGDAVDTKLGVAALASLALDGADLDLEKDEVLSVILTKAGTGALTDASICIDHIVVGN